MPFRRCKPGDTLLVRRALSETRLPKGLKWHTSSKARELEERWAHHELIGDWARLVQGHVKEQAHGRTQLTEAAEIQKDGELRWFCVCL